MAPLHQRKILPIINQKNGRCLLIFGEIDHFSLLNKRQCALVKYQLYTNIFNFKYISS